MLPTSGTTPPLPGLEPALAEARRCPDERFEGIAAGLGLGHLLPAKKPELSSWSPE